jgi:hypothetical protein
MPPQHAREPRCRLRTCQAQLRAHKGGRCRSAEFAARCARVRAEYPALEGGGAAPLCLSPAAAKRCGGSPVAQVDTPTPPAPSAAACSMHAVLGSPLAVGHAAAERSLRCARRRGVADVLAACCRALEREQHLACTLLPCQPSIIHRRSAAIPAARRTPACCLAPRRGHCVPAPRRSRPRHLETTHLHRSSTPLPAHSCSIRLSRRDPSETLEHRRLG